MMWSFRQRLGDFIKDPRQSVRGFTEAPVVVGRTLVGDRDVEWGYVTTRLGRYVKPGQRVLDFGCGGGVLTCAAVQLGARVVAIDLLPQSIAIKHPDIEVRQADIMSLEGSQAFDLIINCSTLEHVGVSGRFDSVEDADRDVAAMQRMRGLLKPGGIMLLTLPVGQDAVFAPQHRVYGAQRLPRVLAGYDVVEAMFWCKGDDNCWALCDRERAMAELGSAQYYALGCMTLRSSSDDRV